MSIVEQESPQVGRPRVLDETKRREICALVSAGASLESAAEYVGCSYVTIYRERQRNESFRTRLGRARATRQLAPLQMMRQAAQTHWRAAAWLLERLDPDHFGRRRPHAFGAKELRALKRDLLDIFGDAIDQPQSREEMSERLQATINYAMRHAWDRRRTGKSLRRAMRLFSVSQPPRDPWDDLLGKLAQDIGHCSETDSFAREADPNLAKSAPPGSGANQNTQENAAHFEGDGRCSPEVL